MPGANNNQPPQEVKGYTISQFLTSDPQFLEIKELAKLKLRQLNSLKKSQI